MIKNGNREKILLSAREILAIKGLKDSTISEIAKKAGVVDSIIYHYFKNKEDLLFYVVEREFEYVHKELRSQFYGIIGPVSKLGKMLWFHLSLNDEHDKEIRILKNLLFESRSYKNFYYHESYKAPKRYIKILVNILKKGIEEGFFYEDLNIKIVRDMIFGLLDEESISCIGCGDVEKTLPDFDNIMKLVLSMIARDVEVPDKAKNKPNKARSILAAAKDVFADSGFNRATMGKIAKHADVSEGTIYEYYNNKNDLLLSIPEDYLKNQYMPFENLFEAKDPLLRLKCFTGYYFYSFLMDKKFIQIYLRDIRLNRKFLSNCYYKSFRSHIQCLDKILSEGKESGYFNPEIDNRIFINLFVGAFTHMAMRWLNLEQTTAIDMMGELNEFITFLERALTFKNKLLSVGERLVVEREGMLA